jgi:hypothetical protein
MPGAKGYLFNGYRHISATLIQMGDIPQAEAFLRRNIALIEEARTSGLPGWRSRYPIVGQSWETDVEYNRAIIFCVSQGINNEAVPAPPSTPSANTNMGDDIPCQSAQFAVGHDTLAARLRRYPGTRLHPTLLRL